MKERTGKQRYRPGFRGVAVLQFEYGAYDPELGGTRTWWEDAKISEVTEQTR